MSVVSQDLQELVELLCANLKWVILGLDVTLWAPSGTYTETKFGVQVVLGGGPRKYG